MDLSVFDDYGGRMREEPRDAAMKARNRGNGVDDVYDALCEVYRRWGTSPGSEIVWKQARVVGRWE